MANQYIIDAEVLGEIKGGYRLKISLVDLGMYILGIRATVSTRDDCEWWIQPPATMTKSGWKPNPEFDKSKDLWLEIVQVCKEAIQVYRDDPHDTPQPNQEQDPFSSEGNLS